MIGKRQSVIDAPAKPGARVDGPAGGGDRNRLLEASQAECRHAAGQGYYGVASGGVSIVEANVAQVDAAAHVYLAGVVNRGMLHYRDAMGSEQLRDLLRFAERVGMYDGRLAFGKGRAHDLHKLRGD